VGTHYENWSFSPIGDKPQKDAKQHVSSGDMTDQAPNEPKLEPEVSLDEARLRQQAIGVKLKQMFDEIVNESVPQDFLDILRRADDKGRVDG
jgi:hypothetical protein